MGAAAFCKWTHCDTLPALQSTSGRGLMQFPFVANEFNEAQAVKQTCKRTRLKGLSVLATATFVALTSTASLAADDISGVTIGSSLAQAQEAIAKANPDFTVTPLMLTNGKAAGVTAKTSDLMMSTGTNHPGGPSDEFAALLNDAGKVWFVARVQRFDKGGRIDVNTFKSALTEKFGQPSDTMVIGAMGLNWQYDRNGKQWTGSGLAPCQGNGTITPIPGVSVTAPRSFSPNCGKIITVRAAKEKDQMVASYTLSITDAKVMFDELASQDANAEAVRKQKLADEQAKAVKPKI
jgi:hypothetical protein